MEDYALLIVTIIVLSGAALLVWRAAAGPARSTGRRILRATLALVVALVITAFGAYQLMSSRTFQLAGDLVPRVETSEKVVALTFDDGPTPEYTDEVLATLRKYDVPATFYLTGHDSEQNTASLQAIVAAGHELGNHTYDHPRLVFLSRAAVADEIERTDAVFRAAGYDQTTTVRPPGCKRLLTAPLYLSGTSRTTVTWDLEPDSIAEIAEDSDAMVAYVVDGVQPGSIVLMHVMYPSRAASREALPRIIRQLKQDGYRFATVSELLALRDKS